MMKTKAWSVALLAAAGLLGILVGRDAEVRNSAAKVAVDAPRTAGATASTVSTSPVQAPSDSAPAIDPSPAPSVPIPPGVGAASAAQADDVHPGEAVDEAVVRKLHGDQPLTAGHPHVKPAIEIQERNNRWIMAHPAVVGTAIGLNDQGEVALVVYTKAEASDLPKAVEGLPIAVFRSGEFFARHRLSPQDAVTTRDRDLQPFKGPPSGGTTVDPTKWFARPVPIGVSTGHPDITAGTIGCRVTDGSSVYALSNNHVYANENRATIGDPVLQPGPYDGGVPADEIGTLTNFVAINFSGENRFDAAIAVCTTDTLGKSTPVGAGYGTPKAATLDAAIGLPVQKYGRTTRHTSAKVSGINGMVNVGYDQGVAYFTGQVFITKGGFSAGGDSGSLIVGKGGSADTRPVALLFAGSSSTTIGSPIGEILTAFGVTVDGN